jgi:hypothetical protein
MKRRDDLLAGTRQALRSWAASNRFNLPHLSKPSPQPMGGRSTGTETDSPSEVKEVERVVNELYKTEPESRRMILLHYLANGDVWTKIKYLQVSSKTYYARLESAEYAVKVGLGY